MTRNTGFLGSRLCPDLVVHDFTPRLERVVETVLAVLTGWLKQWFSAKMLKTLAVGCDKMVVLYTR